MSESNSGSRTGPWSTPRWRKSRPPRTTSTPTTTLRTSWRSTLTEGVAVALPIQPLEMSDFTGGITDNFIGSHNQYYEADNLLITTNGELRTRDGSVIYDDTNYQLPGGGRVSALIEHGDYLLAVCENRLYYENPTWRALTGPSGGHAFVVGDRFSVPSYDTWQDILFLTNDERIKPSKVYLDSTGTLQLRTAGLPA